MSRNLDAANFERRQLAASLSTDAALCPICMKHYAVGSNRNKSYRLGVCEICWQRSLNDARRARLEYLKTMRESDRIRQAVHRAEKRNEKYERQKTGENTDENED